MWFKKKKPPTPPPPEPEPIVLITEDIFRESYKYEETRKTPIKNKVKEQLKCSKNTPFNLMPIARWLPKYSIKRYLINDIMAGFTVAIMHISHSLAYAPMGKVQPVIGFYVAIFPVFIYMLMGTSAHLSIGTFAVICAMTGQAVVKFENKDHTGPVQHTPNTTEEVPPDVPMQTRIQIATAICLLVGLWQALLGLLRLGCFTIVLSESLAGGFTTGAAFHVLSYQLKNLFGLNLDQVTGVFKLIYYYMDFFGKIRTTNLITLGISSVCIALLLFFDEILKPRVNKKFPKNKFPVPSALILIILGTVASYFAGLSKNFNVRIVEYIPYGLPAPMIPPLQILPSLIVDSLTIALVAIAINLSMAKIFAKKGNYEIFYSQEILAYGVSNIFASFFLCIPSAASLSRTTIQYAVGGKTQLANLFSLIVITVIILFAGFLFEPTPYCILSAIVVVSLKELLLQIVFDFPRIWRRSYKDGIVWLTTFVCVVILDLDVGLIIGVICVMLMMGVGFYKLQTTVLGRVPNTNLFLPIDNYGRAEAIPNILILDVTGNLNFTNFSRLENVVVYHFQKFSDSLEGEKSYLILNMTSVSDIDPTSVNTLVQIYKYLKNLNCDLYLTGCNINVYESFERCNIFNDIPKEQIVPTVFDIVDYLSQIRKSETDTQESETRDIENAPKSK